MSEPNHAVPVWRDFVVSFPELSTTRYLWDSQDSPGYRAAGPHGADLYRKFPVDFAILGSVQGKRFEENAA